MRFFSGIRSYMLVKFFAIGKNHYDIVCAHWALLAWKSFCSVFCVHATLWTLSFWKVLLSTCNTAIFSGSWKLPLSSLLNYFCIELEENSLFWLFPFLRICFPWVISFQPHKFELFLHSATMSLKFASDLLLIHFDIIPFALVHLILRKFAISQFIYKT